MQKLHIWSLVIVTFGAIFTRNLTEGSVGGCSTARNCSECITRQSNCAWCSQKNFEEHGNNRCDFLRSLMDKKCDEDNIFYPKNVQKNIKNENLSEKNGNKENIIHLKPQEVHLKLRPKSAYSLLLKYKQVEDYPVDLYYLMDLSNSMKDDKSKLAELGDLISVQMDRITSNFRLGFGSFVDKVVMPYTNTVPSKLLHPCKNCTAPYGFRNHMSLSLDTSQFSREVKSASVSGNLDQPEGGFDAIMQAIVCNQTIGWRRNSRKLLIFTTDSSFHSAGDGRLGGIIIPNDGNCHLNDQGYYSESSLQDYPSISHINEKVRDKKVNIIFAVTQDQIKTYRRVSEKIEGASYGTLTSDSSNIVQIIKDQYQRITSEVQIKDDAPDFVQVTYYSKCLGSEKLKTDTCNGLKVGTEVEFEVRIEILECPKDRRNWKKSFTIYPVGLEPAVINLEAICECECEQPGQQVSKSSICSGGKGSYRCGICECQSGRYGRYCECERNTLQVKNETSCYRQGDTVSCSGRGLCECGVCMCNKRTEKNFEITGKFCECDNYSCDRHQGELCFGPTNGRCECGSCHCLNGRTGNACECEPPSVCINPENNLMCSGNGDCECGTCACNKRINNHTFTGKYCEVQPTLKQGCEKLLPCVQCSTYKTGPLSTGDQCSECEDLMHIQTKDIVEVDDEEELCLVKGDDGCKIKFVYSYNGSQPVIIAQRTQVCPKDDTLVIILGVVGGIVFIGLLTLIMWKILTTMYDRREFAKFEKETKSVKWDTAVNPLFKGATSKFTNPTYNKDST